MDRTILHCDCNGFYASVEGVRDPALRRVPMAVCGDPEHRHGVILAKNELAKQRGVRTAETVFRAAEMPGTGLCRPTGSSTRNILAGSTPFMRGTPTWWSLSALTNPGWT